jgi:hypothetical protein
MNRYIILLILLIPLNASTQPWPGYNTSMYSGIHSLSYQPEIHSVMPSDWDINVLSTNFTFFNENFFGVDPIGEFYEGKINSVDDVSENRTGFVNAYVQLPSFAYRLNDKSTLGFSWRLRALLLSNLSKGNLGKFIHSIREPSEEPVSFSNDFARGTMTTWSSFSFFYSREILDINYHKLFAGISLNILSGAGSAYIDFSDVSFSYANGTISDVDLSIRMAVTEEVDKFLNDNEIPLFSRIGIGTDIGVTYVKSDKSGDGSPYVYKFGFSMNGLGKVNYNTSLKRFVFEY